MFNFSRNNSQVHIISIDLTSKQGQARLREMAQKTTARFGSELASDPDRIATNIKMANVLGGMVDFAVSIIPLLAAKPFDEAWEDVVKEMDRVCEIGSQHLPPHVNPGWSTIIKTFPTPLIVSAAGIFCYFMAEPENSPCNECKDNDTCSLSRKVSHARKMVKVMLEKEHGIMERVSRMFARNMNEQMSSAKMADRLDEDLVTQYADHLEAVLMANDPEGAANVVASVLEMRDEIDAKLEEIRLSDPEKYAAAIRYQSHAVDRFCLLYHYASLGVAVEELPMEAVEQIYIGLGDVILPEKPEGNG